MKTEDLKAQGLTEEQIAFVMAENGKDVKREKDKADSYKTQLDTAKNSLKAFEGVDVEELRGKITTLTNDLATQAKNHKNQLAERDFNDLVNKFASEYKARDVKAVIPFFDVEKLKQSQNQNEDIKSAFEAVKKDNTYLFHLIIRIICGSANREKN